MSETSCGVAGHHELCLCDVHVEKPAEINTSLSGNWLLSMVAEHFDLSYPFDNDKFGFLLQKSSRFLDSYYEEGGSCIPYERGELTRNEYKELAERMFEEHEGETLTEILQSMGTPYHVFIHAITDGNRDPHNTPLELLERVIADLKAGVLSYNDIVRKYRPEGIDIRYRFASKLKRKFGTREGMQGAAHPTIRSIK